MKIKSTRFGKLDIDESRIITFTDEILGFPGHKRFILLDHDSKSLFRWLQSVENEGLAFVVTDPLIVVPEYRIEVKEEDIADLQLSSLENAVVISIVNISEGGKKVTTNLLGPIIVNPDKMLARQVILCNSSYSIQHPIVTTPQQEETMPAEKKLKVQNDAQ